MKKTYQRGSVYLDRRRSIWYFRWREDGISLLRGVPQRIRDRCARLALRA